MPDSDSDFDESGELELKVGQFVIVNAGGACRSRRKIGVVSAIEMPDGEFSKLRNWGVCVRFSGWQMLFCPQELSAITLAISEGISDGLLHLVPDDEGAVQSLCDKRVMPARFHVQIWGRCAHAAAHRWCCQCAHIAGAQADAQNPACHDPNV